MRGRPYLITVDYLIRFVQEAFQSETTHISAFRETGMETPRTAKAHFIWTALVVIIIASCLTYVFMSKVPTCQKVNIVSAPSLFNLTATAMESMIGRPSSRQNWLLKARNCSPEDGRLIWVDEWADNRNETILDQTNMWIVIREKGVYLFYIQANFKLKPPIHSSSPTIDLKLLVDFNYGEDTQIFAAAHDTQVVNTNLVHDAKLNTFLKMDMKSANRLSVRAFPSDVVDSSSRPFSTYITLIKWSDDW